MRRFGWNQAGNWSEGAYRLQDVQQKTDVTVLGIGNIILRDEGFGVHFLRWFSERYAPQGHVAFVDGGTLGYRLIDVITGCRNLIVIDVLKLDDQPGSIYRFTKEEMETHLPPPTSAHDVTFSDLLFKVELMDECPEIVFLCIVPEDMKEMGLEMTSTMTARFPKMEELLIAELSRLGVGVERRTDA